MNVLWRMAKRLIKLSKYFNMLSTEPYVLHFRDQLGLLWEVTFSLVTIEVYYRLPSKRSMGDSIF